MELNDIIYCEAQGKVQCLYLAGGGYRLLRITMTELFGILSCYQEFVRVGVAYIVNLVHVESLSRQEVEMDNGKKIYPQPAASGKVFFVLLLGREPMRKGCWGSTE